MATVEAVQLAIEASRYQKVQGPDQAHVNDSCGDGDPLEGAPKIRSREIMRSEQSGDGAWKKRFGMVGSGVGASSPVEVDEMSNRVVDNESASTAWGDWVRNWKSFVGAVAVGSKSTDLRF